MSWSHILTHRNKDLANSKVDQIAEILYKMDFQQSTHGLLNGDAGVALFLYYYWRWSGKDEYYEKASKILITCIDKLSVPLHRDTGPSTINSSFEKGLSGVGWLINHLIIHDIIEGNIEDTMGTIEPLLFRRMIYDLENHKYGLLDGACGIALYAIGRDNRLSKEYLRRFIYELHQKVFNDNLFDKTENFSIPDGVGGLIILISKIAAKHEDIEGLIELKDYFLCKTEDRINNIIANKGLRERVVANLGWSREEWGLYRILSDYGRLKSDVCHDFENYILANEISLDHYDSGLHNGLIGEAYFMHKVYNNTLDQRFAIAAQNHFERGLKQASFKEQNTGHSTWLTVSKEYYSLHAGLLDGLAGIGLVLMSATSLIKPYWDECLLFS